jgi:hypothetical protein
LSMVTATSHVFWTAFCKQSSIILALSIGQNLGPKEPWIADGAFGPLLCVRDFAIDHVAWGVSFAVWQFCFQSFKCTFTDHFLSILSNPVYCLFVCRIPGFGRSVKLLLVLASTVILAFESDRDPWPCFSFHEFYVF